MQDKYELTFWGYVRSGYPRFYDTYERAEEAALLALSQMENRNAHPAIIHGPDCGKSGRTIT